MTKLERLYSYYGQSLWLDNLTRAYLRDGTLARVVANACPCTLRRAIAHSVSTSSRPSNERIHSVAAVVPALGYGTDSAGLTARPPG